jgi:hypothetical protein
VAVFGMLLAAPAAHASFHENKISEVYGGDIGISFVNAFVELQMYSAGQNFVNTKEIRFYGPSGTSLGTFTFSSDALNGDNQRTILVGDSGVTGGADFVDSALDSYIGLSGAACFYDPAPPTPHAIDCVAWGSFTGAGSLPGPVGTPAPVTPFGTTSLTRSIAPNCPTLLEAGDDGDNSAADFAAATPSPRRNTITPTETPCPPAPPGGGGDGADTTAPDTQITAGPKSKEKKGKATFSFSSTEPGSTFQCSLDGGAFQSCTSPHDVKVKKGKHSFEVRATDAAGNVDGSPAQDSWKVKKKRKK